MGVSENRGPQYSTLDSRIPYKDPQNKVPPILRKLPNTATATLHPEPPGETAFFEATVLVILGFRV